MVLGFVVFIVLFGRIGAVASLLRKESCSGSIHDLAHNPTQNCLADCLTKASAKADNLITAVKRGRLLDVDIHPDFRTLVEHKAFLSTWCRTFSAHKGQGSFLLEQSQDLSCTNSPRTTIPGDVCGDSTDQRAKGIEYALASGPEFPENNVCLRRFLHPISLVSDADSDENADMDDEKHSQPKHHRGFHSGDR